MSSENTMDREARERIEAHIKYLRETWIPLQKKNFLNAQDELKGLQVLLSQDEAAYVKEVTTPDEAVTA